MPLNKLKPGKRNGSVVTLKISSNVFGDFNDENNCPHKLEHKTIKSSIA